jgi:hypothetical protein
MVLAILELLLSCLVVLRGVRDGVDGEELQE